MCILFLYVACQLVNVEGVDVVAVLGHFALGVVHEDHEGLAEEFGGALGVLKKEVAHDDVGSHLVELAGTEVEEVAKNRAIFGL